MDHPILHQKVRPLQTATFLAAGAVCLLVIAALVRTAVPAASDASDANFILFTPGPVLLWTRISLPLLLFLP
jgi:hypothetical protein